MRDAVQCFPIIIQKPRQKHRHETFASVAEKGKNNLRIFPLTIETQKPQTGLTTVTFHLPLRYLSPLFVLIASRPIFRLLLTLCMMIFVAQLSIPIQILTFTLVFLSQRSIKSLLKFPSIFTLDSKRINSNSEEYDFCHVTNYYIMFILTIILLLMGFQL